MAASLIAGRNTSRVHQAAVERTDTYHVRADNMKLNVQGDNVKFLLDCVIGKSGKMIAAELKSCLRIRNAGKPVVAVSETHGNASAQFNAGHDLAIGSVTDGCCNLLQFTASRIGQAMQPVVKAGGDLLACLQSRLPSSARANQNRQEFGRPQTRGSAPRSLSRGRSSSGVSGICVPCTWACTHD